jgi:hypothetical protein
VVHADYDGCREIALIVWVGCGLEPHGGGDESVMFIQPLRCPQGHRGIIAAGYPQLAAYLA